LFFSHYCVMGLGDLGLLQYFRVAGNRYFGPVKFTKRPVVPVGRISQIAIIHNKAQVLNVRILVNMIGWVLNNETRH
jgi:hypothetical protein